MTTIAFARPARSLYSGMILALIALALALQASFLVGLASGGGLAAPPDVAAGLSGKASLPRASSPAPCVNG